MTGQTLFALLGELDEGLVDAAAAEPKRRVSGRRMTAILSFAACAAVVGLVFFLPRAAGKESVTGGEANNQAAAPGESWNENNGLECQAPEGSAGSGSDLSGGTAADLWFEATVLETGDELTVAPAEGSLFYGQAQRVVLDLTDTPPEAVPEDLKPGDTVRITCGTGELLFREDGSAALREVLEIVLTGGGQP